MLERSVFVGNWARSDGDFGWLLVAGCWLLVAGCWLMLDSGRCGDESRQAALDRVHV